MKKKWAAVLMAALLAGSLAAGCGENAKSEAPAEGVTLDEAFVAEEETEADRLEKSIDVVDLSVDATSEPAEETASTSAAAEETASTAETAQ